jgi:hypothetical protein
VEYSEEDPMFNEMLQTLKYAQISSDLRRMEDVCNKCIMLGLGVKRSVVKGLERLLERKMRKRKMKEGEEEVKVLCSEEGKVEVYNKRIGVCQIKSEKKYEKDQMLKIEIYKVEDKTKIAISGVL